MLLFTFFSRAALHVHWDLCLAVYLVVPAIPLTCIMQCHWKVLACMNAPDLATICKCDQLIRFKIDGSTMRTPLMFAIKALVIQSHSWSPFLPLTWLHGKKMNFCGSLCGLLGYSGREWCGTATAEWDSHLKMFRIPWNSLGFFHGLKWCKTLIFVKFWRL